MERLQNPPVDHYQVQPRAFHAALAKLQSLPYNEVNQLLQMLSQGTKIMYQTPPEAVDKPKPENDRPPPPNGEDKKAAPEPLTNKAKQD